MQLKAIIVSTLFLTSTAIVCGQEPPAKGDKAAQDVANKEIEKPAPIYDEQADAREQIAAALVRARKDNRRVLIQWGNNTGDWCGRLHVLCHQNKEIALKLRDDYEVVLVDIGRWKRNQDLAKHYGAELRTSGVPFFTILDAEGTVLVNQGTGFLEAKPDPSKPKSEHKPGYVPEELMAFLTKYQAPKLVAKKAPVHDDNQANADDKPKKKKRDPIYDEQADARKQIAKALVHAEKENRRVLIQWGANWCGWCYLLHDHFKEDREVAKKLMYEYDVVLVDIGNDGKKNRDLATKYEAKLAGVPYLTVLDAKGNVIANQETGSLELQEEGKKGHDGEKVLAFLTKYQAPYLEAEKVLLKGVNQASSDDKRVFVHFGAPWCGWCKRLEAWMARDDVASVLGRYFVDVKIDVDRTQGGKELYQRLSEDKGGGIPWSAVLNEQGDVVAGSFMKGDQNIGYPVTDEEIEAFLAMLATGMDRLSDEDQAFLAASLRKARPKRNH